MKSAFVKEGRQGRVRGEVLCWTEEMPNWERIHSVFPSEVAEFLNHSSPSASPEASEESVPVTAESSGQADKRTSGAFDSLRTLNYWVAGLSAFSTVMWVLGAWVNEANAYSDELNGFDALGSLSVLAWVVVFGVLIYRICKFLPEQHRPFSPAKGTVLFLIPFVDVVWCFFWFIGIKNAISKCAAGMMNRTICSTDSPWWHL